MKVSGDSEFMDALGVNQLGVDRVDVRRRHLEARRADLHLRARLRQHQLPLASSAGAAQVGWRADLSPSAPP